VRSIGLAALLLDNLALKEIIDLPLDRGAAVVGALDRSRQGYESPGKIVRTLLGANVTF
jgi:hypothetical protein